jgi:hypothetical protein
MGLWLPWGHRSKAGSTSSTSPLLPPYQHVEDDAQAPNVHFRPRVAAALEQLGSRVGRGAAKRVQLVVGIKEVAEPEIRNLDVQVGIEQQVLRLRVAWCVVQRGGGRVQLSAFAP